MKMYPTHLPYIYTVSVSPYDHTISERSCFGGVFHSGMRHTLKVVLYVASVSDGPGSHEEPLAYDVRTLLCGSISDNEAMLLVKSDLCLSEAFNAGYLVPVDMYNIFTISKFHPKKKLKRNVYVIICGNGKKETRL